MPLPICQALVGLLMFEVLGCGHDFAKLHRYVSSWRVAPRFPPGDAVDRVCKAINFACVWYPKRVLCLQRAAVTTCLLRSCGVPATMVIGAQIMPFKAHAWTEADGRVLNERRAVDTFYSVLERC
jgi:hypothetical protein